MTDILSELTSWVEGFAESDWSSLALALLSFSEAIFFPVPPDPLLIGISVIRPEAALWLAAIATISSVGGAVVGHWLGRRLGAPLLHKFVSPHHVESAERMFVKYGSWAVALAAFTPIPYKVFAVTAGALKHNLRSFILASLIGRGARFFLLGGLLFVYGESIEQFIVDHFQTLTLAIAAAVIAGGAAVIIVVKLKERSSG